MLANGHTTVSVWLQVVVFGSGYAIIHSLHADCMIHDTLLSTIPYD